MPFQWLLSSRLLDVRCSMCTLWGEVWKYPTIPWALKVHVVERICIQSESCLQIFKNHVVFLFITSSNFTPNLFSRKHHQESSDTRNFYLQLILPQNARQKVRLYIGQVWSNGIIVCFIHWKLLSVDLSFAKIITPALLAGRPPKHTHSRRASVRPIIHVLTKHNEEKNQGVGKLYQLQK